MAPASGDLVDGVSDLLKDFVRSVAWLVPGLVVGLGMLIAALVAAATWRFGVGIALACAGLSGVVHIFLMFAGLPSVALARTCGESIVRLGLGRRIVERALARAAQSGDWEALTVGRELTPAQTEALRGAFVGVEEETASESRGCVGRIVAGARHRLFSALHQGTLASFKAVPQPDGSVRMPSIAEFLASRVDEKIAAALRRSARRAASLVVLADVGAAAALIALAASLFGGSGVELATAPSGHPAAP